MGEDKLSHRQRIRLESLSQAMRAPFNSMPTIQEIFKCAEEIEAWLLKADRELN